MYYAKNEILRIAQNTLLRHPTTREYNESKWYAARLEKHTKLGYVEKVEWSSSYLIPSLYCTKLKIGFQAVLPLGASIEVNKERCTIHPIAGDWTYIDARGLAMCTAAGSVTWHRNLGPIITAFTVTWYF